MLAASATLGVAAARVLQTLSLAVSLRLAFMSALFYSLSRSLSLLRKEEAIRGLLLELQAIGKGCGMIFLISVIKDLDASTTQSIRERHSGVRLERMNK